MNIFDVDHNCDEYEIFQVPNINEIFEAVKGDVWYLKVLDELKKGTTQPMVAGFDLGHNAKSLLGL